jgi:hypothetical protein
MAESIVRPAIVNHHRTILSGLYVDSEDPARVNPQFIHGLPALMATFKAAFGLMGMLRVPVLMGLLSVIAVLVLARELFDSFIAGLIAAALLATNLAQLYFARNPFTEIPNQLFFMSGLWLMVTSIRRADTFLGVLSMIVWLGACTIRPDAYLVFAFALVAISWSEAKEDGARARLRIVAVAALLSCIFAVVLTGPSTTLGYLFNRMQFLAWFAVAFSISLAFAAPWLWQFGWFIRLRSRAYSTGSVRLLSWATFIVLGLTAAWGYWIRPHSVPAICDQPDCYHMLGVRYYDEDTFVRLAWYISPIGLPLATLGIALMVNQHLRRNDSPLLVTTIIGLGYSALYLWAQQAAPMHFWAFRRYLPMVLPFLLIAIAYGLVQVSKRGYIAFAISATVLVYLLARGIVMSAPFIKDREMQGSISALRTLAKTLPPKAILATNLESADSQLLLPLQLIFGFEVLPIAKDGSNRVAVEEAITVLKRTREVLFVCYDTASCDWAPRGWEKRLHSELTFSVPRSEQTLDRAPRAYGALGLHFTAFDLVPTHATH